MLGGILHEGSGLGDQLFRYITVRTLAEEKGYLWGMLYPENYKGDSFMSIKKASDGLMLDDWEAMHRTWNEKAVYENGVDIRSYDPEINFVEDHTTIDGSFEDSRYWAHNLDNINKWLAVEPLEVPENKCVIGFRGGEYYSDPQLGLPPSYFMEAMEEMLLRNEKMRFEIHTDDPQLARQFFPHFEVVDNQKISHSKHSNMGYNWRSARYAKYAIIPNSAFFILPRLLKHHEDPTAVTIAPRGWSRRNLAKGKGAGDFIWARPACYYKPFLYV